MKIRQRQLADDQQLVELYAELGYLVSLEQLTLRLNRLLTKDDYQLWLAEDEQGQILGMLGFCKMQAFEFDEPYVRVLALVTKSEFRRLGVASQLLENLQQWCLVAGCRQIALNTGIDDARQVAHQFYRRYGFQEKSKGFVLKVEAKP